MDVNDDHLYYQDEDDGGDDGIYLPDEGKEGALSGYALAQSQSGYNPRMAKRLEEMANVYLGAASDQASVDAKYNEMAANYVRSLRPPKDTGALAALRFAAGMLQPTRTGSFAESIGNAAPPALDMLQKGREQESLLEQQRAKFGLGLADLERKKMEELRRRGSQLMMKAGDLESKRYMPTKAGVFDKETQQIIPFPPGTGGAGSAKEAQISRLMTAYNVPYQVAVGIADGALKIHVDPATDRKYVINLASGEVYDLSASLPKIVPSNQTAPGIVNPGPIGQAPGSPVPGNLGPGLRAPSGNLYPPQAAAPTAGLPGGAPPVPPSPDNLPPPQELSTPGSKAMGRPSSLYGDASKAVGVVPAIADLYSRTIGQIPGVPVPSEATDARQTLVQASNDLVRALVNNPKFTEGERKAIKREIEIEPSVFDSPSAWRNRAHSLDRYLRLRAFNDLQLLNNPGVSSEERSAAMTRYTNIYNFLGLLGVPNIPKGARLIENKKTGEFGYEQGGRLFYEDGRPMQ